MSILNPTSQEIDDDKIRTYREYWNPTEPIIEDAEDPYVKKLTEALSNATMYDYVKTKQKTFVVAGTYAEYLDWIKRKGYSTKEYIYVYKSDNLRGISPENLKGIYIGTWRNRPDIDEIRQTIFYTKAKNSATPVTGTMVTGSIGTSTSIYYDGQSYPINETISSSSISGTSATIAEIVRDEVRSKIRVDLRNKLQHEINKMMPYIQKSEVERIINQVLDEY